MKSSIKNMYDCLSSHPAIQEKREQGQSINLLIGSDKHHIDVSKAILDYSSDFAVASYTYLEEDDPEKILTFIDECDVFIFLHSSSTLPSPSPKGPKFLEPLREHMTLNWKKSVLFKDYGNYFFEAFSEERESIKNRNEQLISLLNTGSQIKFEDNYGGQLVGSLSPNQKWTSINGFGNTESYQEKLPLILLI